MNEERLRDTVVWNKIKLDIDPRNVCDCCGYDAIGAVYYSSFRADGAHFMFVVCDKCVVRAARQFDFTIMPKISFDWFFNCHPSFFVIDWEDHCGKCFTIGLGWLYITVKIPMFGAEENGGA